MKKLAISIFFLLITLHLFAWRNYSFRSFSIEIGLSNTKVNSILIDNRGTLWIGTDFGLNAYDGYEMKNFFHKKEEPYSLPNSYVLYLAKDIQDNIWVSTMKGLVRYDKSKNLFYPPLDKQIAFSRCFLNTKEGVIFGGVGQLYEFSYKSKTFRSIPIDIGNTEIFNINEWQEGVYLLTLSSGEIKEYHYEDNRLQASIISPQPNAILSTYIDKEKNLYLAVHQSGLFIYNKNGELKTHITTSNSALSHNTILDIEEKNGELWLATDGGGINIMSLTSPMEITDICHTPGDDNSIPSNSISHLYKDNQGNIWAGSVRKGAFEIKETPIRTYKEAPIGKDYGLSNQTILSFCQDTQGLFWIGTDGGGVNRFNPQNNTFTHYPLTANEKVVSIVDYSASELLVLLYYKGTYLFDKRTGQCKPYSPPFMKYSNMPNLFLKITNDCILILSHQPCLYYLKEKKTRTLKLEQSLEWSGTASLVGVTDEYIYLQERNNLLRIDLDKNEIGPYYTVNSDEILQVASYDSNGYFWIGTDCGLRKYDPTNNKYEKIETNLFSRVVSITPEDGKRLWINAQNLLFSYNLENNKILVWNESDGFTQNEITNMHQPLTYNDYMYLGGINGFVQIDKKITSATPTKTDIRLADVLLDGVSILENNNISSSLSEISVPWNYKRLQLKITDIANDIFMEKLFKYSIQRIALAGTEKKVIETYNPIISLDMLSPGKYYINASAYTKTGTWSAPQQILHLHVTTPWYKDFQILMGLTTLLFIIIMWRLWAYFQKKKQKMKWEMNKIAQNADKEKVQFLINISHELRTPLTLIYAPLKKMLENISSKNLEPEEQKTMERQLANVYRSASQMKTIINMTLDVNRISEKGNILCIRPHLLNEWIIAVTSEFEYEFKNRSAEVNYMLDERIAFIDFDDSKSVSILSNLIMNALKFSEKNTEITISSKLMTNTVRISISDKGIGLGNINPEQLFTRFYQGEHNRQGSGIGLYYSKILIDQQGGTIGAFNNPDKGATFYFEFPLQSSKLSEVPHGEIPISELSKLSDTGFAELNFPDSITPSNTYSVVVVEDNIELSQYLADILKEKFKTVYTAPNGEEAWQTIVEKMPDIIVSDIMMPLKNGYELCRQTKENILTCHIPVILLTARSDHDSTLTGYKLGADAYIPKPFDTEFLLVMIHNLLQNREMMKKKYRENFIHITEENKKEAITNRDEEFLLRLNQIIIENITSSQLNVTYIAEQMAVSRTVLYRKLKALIDVGVNDYINQIRIEKATQLLLQQGLTIGEISDAVGFEYQKYFSTVFKQIKGVTPSQFRQGEI